ncbi:MAG: CPBP family intramembrane metalloprotease [Treponema sp.]|jgi:membrane protease YdiL (CAAX protease family)|nr:CPBP family intramembrane metalloprotease [Treponema sp.]
MGIYIESLILYIVLFFSGSAASIANSAGKAAGFSAAGELEKIFLYTIPSLALIWYMLLRGKQAGNLNILPGKKDILSGLITLPCLLISGFIIALISAYAGGTSAQISLYSPSSITEWAILCFSCISAAYLEESYFRFYLLSRKDEFKLGAASVLAVSVALFSICHIYEGTWGILNSVISAVILGVVFLRYQALHGIAIAHGLYNITVYVVYSIMYARSALA